jgi:hypothetical protein
MKNRLLRKKQESSYTREAIRIKTGISTNRNAFVSEQPEMIINHDTRQNFYKKVDMTKKKTTPPRKNKFLASTSLNFGHNLASK